MKARTSTVARSTAVAPMAAVARRTAVARSTAAALARAALVAAAALAFVGCGATAAPAPTAAPDDAVYVSANNVVFEQQLVAAPAGRPFELYFDNREPVPHNVHLLDATGTSIMQGEVFSGPTARLHQVPSLTAGTYTILCDVHPNMTAPLIAGP